MICRVEGRQLELFRATCGKLGKVSSGGYSFKSEIKIPSEKSIGSFALMEQLKLFWKLSK